MKLIKSLILVIVMLVVSALNVSAAEFPQNYEANGIKYTIEGMSIKILDEEGIRTNTVYKTISIPADKITINPVASEINVPTGHTSATGVKVNYTLSDISVEELVRAEIPTIEDNNKQYLVLVTLDYKITEIPEGYNYIHYVNFFDYMKLFIDSFSNPSEEATIDTRISLNQSVSQNVGAAAYGKENDEIYFKTGKIEGTDTDMLAVQDYVVLSNEEKVEFSDSTLVNPKSGHRFIIHNLDDIDGVLAQVAADNSNSSGRDNSSTSTTTTTKKTVTAPGEKVKVPDTNKNISILLLSGALLLITGGIYIFIKPKEEA